MTTEYGPHDERASRGVVNFPYIQALTLQSPHINNQNILPSIQAETSEYMLVMDQFALGDWYSPLKQPGIKIPDKEIRRRSTKECDHDNKP